MKNSMIKWAGIALAGLGAAAMSSAALADASLTRTKFPKNTAESSPAEFSDGVHSLAWDGLVQFDWTHFGADVPLKEGYPSGFTYGGSGRNDQQVYGDGFSTGLKARRVALNWRGSLGCDWQFRAGLGFEPSYDVWNHGRTDAGIFNGPGDSTGIGRFNVRLLPTFMNYSGFADNINVAFGQISPFIGLENSESSKDLLFLERSLVGATFDAPYLLGAMAHGYWDYATVNVSMFTNSADSAEGNVGLVGDASLGTIGTADKTKKNDKWGIAGRLTFSPVHDSEKTVHFGVHGWYQGLLEATRENYSGGADIGAPILVYHTGMHAYPEACSRQNAVLVSTGYFTARAFTQMGVEAAGTYGPWHLRAEFMHRRYDRVARQLNSQERNLCDPKFYGWTISGSYLVTGESREYDAKYGVFRNPTPNCCAGAWEIAARYSYIRLQDPAAGFDGMFNDANQTFATAQATARERGFNTDKTGSNRFLLHGRQHNISVGVNWMPSHHIKVSGNYIHAKAKYADCNRCDEKMSIWAVRAQFAW